MLYFDGYKPLIEQALYEALSFRRHGFHFAAYLDHICLCQPAIYCWMSTAVTLKPAVDRTVLRNTRLGQGRVGQAVHKRGASMAPRPSWQGHLNLLRTRKAG